MSVNMTRAAIICTASAALFAAAPAASAEDCSPDFQPGLIALDVGYSTVLGYVPQSAVGHKVPLVVNLHPSGGTGLRTLNASKDVAQRNGFVMIAPTGSIGPIYAGWTWNLPGVPAFGGDANPSADARDDVAFIASAIDAAQAATCIDPARIYVMGFSGGGRMASQLACDLSDRIASVVPIGGIRFPQASDTELGLPDAVQCSPDRPVPIQAIHGKWDPTNPWFDEALGQTPFTDPGNANAPIMAGAPQPGSSWSYSGAEALRRWVAFNGCDAEPALTELAPGIAQRDYQNCTDGAEVSLIFYDGLGHAVPGHEEPWSPGQADSPFDGFQQAWDLMQDDRLPD